MSKFWKAKKPPKFYPPLRNTHRHRPKIAILRAKNRCSASQTNFTFLAYILINQIFAPTLPAEDEARAKQNPPPSIHKTEGRGVEPPADADRERQPTAKPSKKVNGVVFCNIFFAIPNNRCNKFMPGLRLYCGYGCPNLESVGNKTAPK